MYIASMVFGWAVVNNFDDTWNGNLNPSEPVEAVPIFFDWNVNIFYALPIFCFAFASHTQVYQLYSETADGERTSMLRVVYMAMFFVTSIYIIVGTFGYFTFYSALDGMILNNYTDEGNVAVVLAKLGLSCVLVFSTPLFLPPMRFVIYRSWMTEYAARHVSTPIHIITTLAVFLVLYLLALFVPDMTDVLALAGATSCSCIQYIFPSLFYLALEHRLEAQSYYQVKGRRLVAQAIFALGVAIGLAGTIVSITQFGVDN